MKQKYIRGPSHARKGYEACSQSLLTCFALHGGYVSGIAMNMLSIGIHQQQGAAMLALTCSIAA